MIATVSASPEELYQELRKVAYERECYMKDIAAEIGIDPGIVSRLKAGRWPNARNYGKILAYLRSRT